MKTAAEILFESRYGSTVRPDANDPVLTNYYALLKRELTKRQRGFVLSIIDRMGLFIEQESRRYFAEGLRLGCPSPGWTSPRMRSASRAFCL